MQEIPSPPFAEVLAQFQEDPLSLLRRIPGIWLLDKPTGPSSNLMVVRARKALNLKKIGHAGTLDPLASGLLILLAGNATRLFDQLQLFPKTYLADFELGRRTDSQDILGQPLPDWLPERAPPVSRDDFAAALPRFMGDIMQLPPMHSALKKGGQPLYKLARKGVSVERQPRPATVYTLELLEFTGTTGKLVVSASKGFYVRTLIDDLGTTLGCGAVMTALRRTAVGPFSVGAAVPLENPGVPE